MSSCRPRSFGPAAPHGVPLPAHAGWPPSPDDGLGKLHFAPEHPVRGDIAMGFLAGKRALIVGVATDLIVAYGGGYEIVWEAGGGTPPA